GGPHPPRITVVPRPMGTAPPRRQATVALRRAETALPRRQTAVMLPITVAAPPRQRTAVVLRLMGNGGGTPPPSRTAQEAGINGPHRPTAVVLPDMTLMPLVTVAVDLRSLPTVGLMDPHPRRVKAPAVALGVLHRRLAGLCLLCRRFPGALLLGLAPTDMGLLNL